MDETRWIARRAASFQLIADSYRDCARSSTADVAYLKRQAAALDRLAAALLSDIHGTDANPAM